MGSATGRVRRRHGTTAVLRFASTVLLLAASTGILTECS